MRTPSYRVSIETNNPLVKKYAFQEAPTPIQYPNEIDRYFELITKRREGKTDEGELQEIETLLRVLKNYQIAIRRNDLKSILANSETEIFLERGKDNRVYTNDRDGKYVFKYSSDAYNATPNTVEYLVKKYKMLKRYLGEFIPDSAFVFGDRLSNFTEKNLRNSDTTTTHAITIQRKIKGKTFQDLETEEKIKPEIMEQLKKSRSQYLTLKTRVEKACKKLNLPEDTLDVKLDLGGISKRNHLDIIFEKEMGNYKSPNIMYDGETKKIMFIDFDMNEWDENKEKVYQLVMSDDKL